MTNRSWIIGTEIVDCIGVWPAVGFLVDVEGIEEGFYEERVEVEE
jgi:hypothetical protein